jgi:trimethylamine:corrinoid methyltransferase-like protein
VQGDLPTDELVKELIQDDHLITSPHTLEHWPNELYLTDPVFDRLNRESWEEAGSEELQQRANKQVEQRLRNYAPFETDPHIDAAMRALIVSGLKSQTALPELLPAAEPALPKAQPGHRGRAGRRRRIK